MNRIKIAIVGWFGTGNINPRGELCVNWCKRNEQIITNIWFKTRVRRIWTWKSPSRKSKNQIDFITVSRRFRNIIKTA